MKKIIMKSFIAGIFLFLATSSFAISRDSGTYLEGNVGISVVHLDLFWIIPITGFNGAGANANVGYQFNRNFASEMGYTIVSGARYGDAAMKAILPFQIKKNDFTIFGKLGAAYVYDNQSHEVTPYLGLGASYALSPSLDINMQGQAVTASNVTIGLLSLGLTYHFN